MTITTQSNKTGVGIQTPVEVHPTFQAGGNLAATAPGGAAWIAFTAQVLQQLTIVNDTGFVLEFQQNATGAACPILDQSSFTIFGVSDASQIRVRRKDQGVDPVTVSARWEN